LVSCIRARHGLAVIGVVIGFTTGAAWAEQGTTQGAGETTDRAALVERITERVLDRLLGDARFQDAVERGIARYVEKRRSEQASVRQRALDQRARAVRPVSESRDHIRCDAKASVMIIEYSDFECPFCKRFHPIVKGVLNRYNGKVAWVYRHFPLEFHNPNAEQQAQASECAADQGGNEAFWRFADTLYGRTRSNKGFPSSGLVPLATELGLDGNEFKSCLESGRFAGRVREYYEEGQRIGISGTPGTVLLKRSSGQVRVVSGAVPAARLQRSIDRLLAAK